MAESTKLDAQPLAPPLAHLAAAELLPFKLLLALKRHGKLTPGEALEIFDEMLEGLPADLLGPHHHGFRSTLEDE